MTPPANRPAGTPQRPAGTPAATVRLFPHHPFGEVLASPDFLIGRLLEDGDGADLRWLFSNQAVATVRQWFATSAGRQLSTRSRAFWAVVLDREPSASVPVAEDLWLL